MAEQVGEARAGLRHARAGNWAPYEQHLRNLGIRHARSSVPLSAWNRIASAFHDAIVVRAVEMFASQPARLTQVLLAANELIERSLTLIGDEYYAAKQRREGEGEVKARHRHMLDAAPDAVIELDEHGIVLELNPAAERTFGYREADAVGKPLESLIIPARDRARHAAGLARALADNQVISQRTELTAMRADGSELQVELTRIAVDRLGGGRSFIGFLRDLTEQGHTEQSRALSEHALEQAQFGIVVTEPSTRTITNVNPAYARMLGYEPHELIGTKGDRLAPADSAPIVQDIARQLIERGHHTYELRLVRKDGSTVPVLASTTSFAARSGTTMRISTVIDMSQREAAERARAAAQQELERSAARLAILSSTAHEFAAATGHTDSGVPAAGVADERRGSSDGRSEPEGGDAGTGGNPPRGIQHLLQLVVRRLGEIIGEACAIRMTSRDGQWLEPAAAYYHPDAAIRELVGSTISGVRKPVGEGLAGRVAASGVAELVPIIEPARLDRVIPSEIRRALTSELPLSSALAVPLRAGGRTLGVINLMRSAAGNPYCLDDQRLAQDLADRAALAIENALLVANLEERVCLRTAELEAVNRELEAFSYSVSHDLRTPLRAIDGFSRALLSDYEARLDDHGRHYLHRIRSATQRMSSLIDDLLDLARISRVPLELADQDLSALAAEVVAELRKRDPERTLLVHIAPAVVARADARMLRIVLENLLGNAWKFTAKHAAAQIWFGASGDAFYVRDTGAGFDMDYAQKLFTPFQRLHTGDDYDGTGVGLATVHRIVTHHGGLIWAEAELDKGATFFFTLGDSHGRAG